MNARSQNRAASHLLLPVLLLAACEATPPDPASVDVQREIAETKDLFLRRAPHLRQHFDGAYAYALFPKVGKGGLVFGGGGGKGYVVERGKLAGGVTLSMATFGAQIGGESFAEVIFFEDEPAFARLEQNKFEFGATVNAVAAEAGASRHAKFHDGILVVTTTHGGLMAEASVAGQKFDYAPIGEGEVVK
jgi:lipid-binding SYLF domain-containing protein